MGLIIAIILSAMCGVIGYLLNRHNVISEPAFFYTYGAVSHIIIMIIAFNL